MEIHGHIDRDQFSIDGDYDAVFLGECHGVGLKHDHDGMIMCRILTEDDGHWFYSQEGLFSSYWLPVLSVPIQQAIDWLDENAEVTKWGWKRKEKA